MKDKIKEELFELIPILIICVLMVGCIIGV